MPYFRQPNQIDNSYDDDASSWTEHLGKIWRHPTTAGIQVGSFLVVVVIAIVVVLHLGATNPVPSKIRSQVSYPIYYPNQKLLPNGYKLNVSSFKVADAQKDAVVYAIDYPGGKIVVSDQPKPSTSDIDTFVHNHIPISYQILTPVGTAVVGGIGAQTVASLPTSSNIWIIVAAPAGIYQTEPFAQVLKSFVQPR